LGRQGTRLTLVALTTFTVGVPFYIAVILLLQYPLVHPGPAAATFAVGLLIAGLPHPLLFLLLRQRSLRERRAIPFEAYDLFALLAGALTTLVAASFAILNLVVRGSGVAGNIGQAIGAFFQKLSAPGCQQGQSCPVGPHLPSILPVLVVVAVGFWIVLLHGWFARREGFLPALPARDLPHRHARDGELAAAVESVVKAVETGDMTNEQAVAHLRKLIQT
jgi:hypothetical protein